MCSAKWSSVIKLIYQGQKEFSYTSNDKRASLLHWFVKISSEPGLGLAEIFAINL